VGVRAARCCGRRQARCRVSHRSQTTPSRRNQPSARRVKAVTLRRSRRRDSCSSQPRAAVDDRVHVLSPHAPRALRPVTGQGMTAPRSARSARCPSAAADRARPLVTDHRRAGARRRAPRKSAGNRWAPARGRLVTRPGRQGWAPTSRAEDDGRWVIRAAMPMSPVVHDAAAAGSTSARCRPSTLAASR
jgi:hypothetical protein